jgi:hypothetical protein
MVQLTGAVAPKCHEEPVTDGQLALVPRVDLSADSCRGV